MAEQTLAERNPQLGKFLSFYEQEYKKQIEHLVKKYPEERSLNVDFKDLERFDFELADELLESPDDLIKSAELAIESVEVPSLQVEKFAPHIRFFNLPDDRKILLRNLGSAHLNKLICVEGVIKQITDVLPKLKKAAWQCRRCGNVYNVVQDSPELKKPAFCDCRHHDFSLVEAESEFVDYQKILIQESLEALKGNEQPTDIQVYMSDDLVNKVSAGDKIIIIGILRLGPLNKEKAAFTRYLEVRHLDRVEREFEDIVISEEEEEEIKQLAKDPQVFDKLVKSLAPGIYGHEMVKEAIILQLFGGVKKVMPNEQKIRGNIHVLLVGEPGVAKSQMLLAANALSPKGIYIAGKTSSGAGISATAVKDEFGEGGWTIKAGALVLASGGVAFIDELDKMDAEDRSAMHESLEQQSISVAKAGITTRFKTETSVLAASNPKYSRFDPYSPYLEQIDLPPTLISRFDLFFLIKDVLDKKKDLEIATHILKTHQGGEKIQQQKILGKKISKEEWKEIEARITPPIPTELVKKYISFGRQNIFPVLSKQAIALISDFYVGLREKGKQDGNYAATHRQLEGLIRLSESSARVRLSDTVEVEDANRAIRLFEYCLEGTVKDPETGKIDIDILTSGKSHSQTESIKKILRIIKEKSVELDEITVEDILKEAEVQGIDRDRAKDYLEDLHKKGDIYYPRHNIVKPASRQ